MRGFKSDMVMESNPGVRLVVFDWAGTVVDFGCQGPAKAFVDGFAQVGVPVTMAEARGPMGLAKKEHIRQMLCMHSVSTRWNETKGRSWTESDVEDIYRWVTPMQVEAAGRLGRPIDGVVECVEMLRSRGVRIGGTTGYFREAADAAREEAARHGYRPDVSVCADEVPAGRPAPWMLFRVMELTGCYPANRVIKIGDTKADIEEGVNAGAFSVGVIDSSNAMGLSTEDFQNLDSHLLEEKRNHIQNDFLRAGAHATICNLSELHDLLDNVYPRWLESVSR
ncbi:phosphonoacetaldehyde hydrolase [Pirellulaceae bacterium SH467]|jgi:phosphonoacetaldehyde hydrolase